MNDAGWIKIHRDILRHPVLRSPRFSRLEAWLWMLAAAAYADHEVDVGGKLTTVRRGQFCHSIRFMGEAWGWGNAAVDRFLTRLKTETMIGTATGTGRLIVTICNYEKYQSSDAMTGTLTGTRSGTRAERERNEEEEGKEGKEEDLDLGSSDAVNGHASSALNGATKVARFAEFWDDAYPHRNGRKKGRKTAEAKYVAAVKRGVSEETIIAGARAAVADPDVARGFARDPTTWLNQEGWRDETSGAPGKVKANDPFADKLRSWGIPVE